MSLTALIQDLGKNELTRDHPMRKTATNLLIGTAFGVGVDEDTVRGLCEQLTREAAEEKKE